VQSCTNINSSVQNLKKFCFIFVEKIKQYGLRFFFVGGHPVLFWISVTYHSFNGSSNLWLCVLWQLILDWSFLL